MEVDNYYYFRHEFNLISFDVAMASVYSDSYLFISSPFLCIGKFRGNFDYTVGSSSFMTQSGRSSNFSFLFFFFVYCIYASYKKNGGHAVTKITIYL